MPKPESVRAVFLDRDGVLNRAIVHEDGKPYAPMVVEDFELLPDAAAQTRRLKEHGFLLLVATNQPEVSRGNMTMEALCEMHRQIEDAMPIDEFLICWHDDKDGCACRKPRAGLILQAAVRYGIDLSRSYMVGDRWRDVESGQRAGVHTIFLDYRYQEKRPENEPSATVGTLTEAVDWIVTHSR